MGVTRSFRLAAGVLAGALVLGAAGTTAAEAKPPIKPGGVTNLAATVTGVSGKYDVASTWTAANNATAYRVSLKKAGTTLASTTVSTTSWDVTVSTSIGTASLSVQPVATKRPGPTSTITVNLPDITPPSGTFERSWDNNTGVATITQDSLSDDSGAANVTRTVDWGDGTTPVVWTPGTTQIQHTYPLVMQGYDPTVTLEDAAHNTTVVHVATIVIDDEQAPTGTYTAGPSSAWAKLTPVTLTQTALSDNWSLPANITRSVDWGDGSAPQTWAPGTTTLTHVYTIAGVHTPSVTLTDQAGNVSLPIAASAVTVKSDTTAPIVRLTLAKNRHSVRAWKTLRGRATDPHGTGVKKVNLRAVEKRGSVWYGYSAPTRTWVKAKTESQAFSRSRAFTLKTTATHTWAAYLAKLTKGTLVYKVTATDRVNNISAPVTRLERLTQR